MPIDIEVATTIRRPRSAVALVMFDPDHDTAWVSGMRATRRVDTGDLRVGSQVERHISFLGRRYTAVATMQAVVPNRLMAFTAERPLRLQTRYELEGIPEGAIARVHVLCDAFGLLRPLRPALRALLRRKLIRDLDTLKALLEQGAFRFAGTERDLSVAPATVSLDA
ncbi:MAG TPA: SRPBCC family protein [Acetobacteraceae bacterium]|nr:SRPBCC family protein [Acetobacteraceae bacterium]